MHPMIVNVKICKYDPHQGPLRIEYKLKVNLNIVFFKIKNAFCHTLLNNN